MENKLHSLSKLFHQRLFRIPDYQRGYAWKHEQLVDFWEDLLNLNEDKYHYTGLLSLKAINKNEIKSFQDDDWLIKKDYVHYHVVDGQQRLTTFSILMNEIIYLVKNLPVNKDKSDADIYIDDETLKEIIAKYIVRRRPPENLIITYLFRYETDNPSDQYLRHKIFNEEHGGALDESYYTKNLNYAKLFFSNNLNAFFADEGMAGIEILYRKLTLKLMFNLHEIKDDYDVFVAFETMNNRGKKLTNLELLKNRLIYLTTLYEEKQLDNNDKEQLRVNINDAWKEVYYQLGRHKESPLSDDDFLRAHWITYYKYSRRDGQDYIRFLLNKFSAKNIFEKYTVFQELEKEIIITDYVQNEDDSIDNENDVIEISVSKLKPKEINDYLNSLKQIAKYWYFTYFPYDSDFSADEKLWIDRLNRIGISYFRPLVASTLSRNDISTPAERTNLFKAIERYIFIYFRFAGYSSLWKSTDYYNKAREILNNQSQIVTITKEINKMLDKDKEDVVRSFILQTSKKFKSGKGFFGWHGLRYFLFEYEVNKGTEKKLQKIDWSLFTNLEKDKITIEHILPQTPSNSYWRNQYRAYTNEEIKYLTGSLGNLLPLSQSINSSLQNDSFPDKKNPLNGKRRGYTDGSHSEIEISHEIDWTAQSIYKRGIVLLEFMESRWGVVFTDEQKSELLNIDFIHNERGEAFSGI